MMISRRSALTTAGWFLTMLGCSGPRDSETAAPPKAAGDLGVQLVDSFVVAIGPDQVLWRLRVDPAGVIPDVLVAYPPTVVGDTAVMGVRFDTTGTMKDLFRYDGRTRATTFSSIPRRLLQDFSNIAISPTGDFAASLFIDDSGKAQAQLIHLASGKATAVSTPILPVATDGRFATAKWVGDTAFVEFATASERIVQFRVDRTGSAWRANRPLDSITAPTHRTTEAQHDSASGLVHVDSVFQIAGPTLLTTFPVTWRDLDASEHAAEALNDYGGSLQRASGPLRRAGVTIHATNDDELKWQDSLGVHSVDTRNSYAILYVFITPDGRMRILRGDIQPPTAILDAARKHFGIALADTLPR